MFYSVSPGATDTPLLAKFMTKEQEVEFGKALVCVKRLIIMSSVKPFLFAKGYVIR